MKKKILALALVISLLACIFAFASRADFGDYGGDSDFGDWGGSDWDDDDDYDWGGSGSSSGSTYFHSGGSDDGGGWVVGLAIFVVIIVLIIISNKQNQKKAANRPVVNAGGQRTDPATLRNVSEYVSGYDPGFNEAEFKEKLANLYVQMQNGWQDKNLEPLRPYLTDAFYAQMDRQLDSYRRNKQTNRIERINVQSVTVSGWKQEGGNDVMIAELNTRIVDYVVDDNTGNIVRGSNTAEKFMVYEWSIVRTSGHKTGEGGGTTVQNCPNCGAPININRTAKCEYCDCIVTVDSFDWAVNTIKGIAQRTQ